jgi:hypothetical protein
MLFARAALAPVHKFGLAWMRESQSGEQAKKRGKERKDRASFPSCLKPEA